MNKAVVFGAGTKTRSCIGEMKERYDVIAIVDNDKSSWGGVYRWYKNRSA